MRGRSWTRALILGLGVLVGTGSVRPAGAEEIHREPIPTLVPRPGPAPQTGEVLVKFRDGVVPARKAQILGVSGARVARVTRGSGFVVLRPRPGGLVSEYVRALRRRWEVAAAEPNYLAMAASLDPYFDPYQWNLFDTGDMSARAPSNYGINAPAAWSFSRGDGVTVALLDTGCAYAEYQ